MMKLDQRELISRYLDDDLSEEEHAELQQWLMATSANMAQLVQASLIHDRLRGELTAMSIQPISKNEQVERRSREFRTSKWKSMTLFGATLVGLVILVAFWNGTELTQLTAAAELNRLIAAQETGGDRTYLVDVEEIVAIPSGEKSTEDLRPPKPSMDDAKLHVRQGKQFVLIRQTPEGLPFATGCNGNVSWAAKPDGPVRVSSDLNRFNRDVPGHEHGMPLINLQEGLGRLKEAYDVQLLPIEVAEDDSDKDSTRLFVAVKRRGFRGPQRVEITYEVTTGQIQQLRFVGMPYGPDRLTLRLTLLDQRDLGATFFDHQSHHSSDRTIVVE